MAYRSSRRSSGGYRSRSSSRGRRPARRKSVSRRRSSSAGSRTLRIVIEQPGMHPMREATYSAQSTGAARRARF